MINTQISVMKSRKESEGTERRSSGVSVSSSLSKYSTIPKESEAEEEPPPIFPRNMSGTVCNTQNFFLLTKTSSSGSKRLIPTSTRKLREDKILEDRLELNLAPEPPPIKLNPRGSPGTLFEGKQHTRFFTADPFTRPEPKILNQPPINFAQMPVPVKTKMIRFDNNDDDSDGGGSSKMGKHRRWSSTQLNRIGNNLKLKREDPISQGDRYRVKSQMSGPLGREEFRSRRMLQMKEQRMMKEASFVGVVEGMPYNDWDSECRKQTVSIFNRRLRGPYEDARPRSGREVIEEKDSETAEPIGSIIDMTKLVYHQGQWTWGL